MPKFVESKKSDYKGIRIEYAEIAALKGGKDLIERIKKHDDESKAINTAMRVYVDHLIPQVKGKDNVSIRRQFGGVQVSPSKSNKAASNNVLDASQTNEQVNALFA